MRYNLLLVIVVFKCLALSGSLSGCASHPPEPYVQDEKVHEDTFEGYNRNVHDFNGGLHENVVHPVGSVIDFIFPDFIEEGFNAFFENLSVPNTAINNLAQGKLKYAGQDVMRFGINTTLGLLGFIDWATKWGIPKHDEDLGQTLAYYGVEPGPYLSIPVIGGTTPRDIFAGVVSIDPRYLIGLDGLVVARGIEVAFGLSEKSRKAQYPTYDEEREQYYLNEHCNAIDKNNEEQNDFTLDCSKINSMGE